MDKNLEEIIHSVLERVKPSPEEAKCLNELAREVMSVIDDVVRGGNLSEKVTIELEGSLAKGTWLSGEADVDIFLLFDPSIPLDVLRREGLRIGRKTSELLGVRPLEKYAAHPYVEFSYGGARVEVVPAYRVSSPDKMITPVDRTPFHTKYVMSKLKANVKLGDEILLFKRFLKGIGAYGAEIKVEGFSGYLAEVLVAHYGSFVELLRNSSNWKPWQTVIDPEQHYEPGEIDTLVKAFRAPLIVVDPIDKHRNAASAVSLEKLSLLIAASRGFLENPSVKFFFPEPPKIRRDTLSTLLKGRGIVAMATIMPSASEDVSWAQVKKSLRSIETFLERQGFKVYYAGAWASDRTLVLLLELDSLTRPELVEHKGPPVYSQHSTAFTRKYENRRDVVGPYIRGDRWIVLKRRKFVTAKEILRRHLFELRLGRLIADSLAKKLEILAGEEILTIAKDDRFIEFLFRFVTRKMPWVY